MESLTATFVAARSLIMAVGLLGNLLVIVVIAISPKLQSRLAALLVNLAVADLLSLITCVPHSILQEFPHVYKPLILCKAAFWLEHLFTMASSLTTVLLAAERFVVVVMPLRASVILRRRGLRTAAMTSLWAASLISTLPFCIVADVSGQVANNQTIFMCNLSPDGKTMYFVCTVLELYAPMCITCVLYAVIFRVLVRSFGQLRPKATGDIGLARALRRRRRAVHFSLLVTVVFFLTVVPFRSFALCWSSVSCFEFAMSTLGDGGAYAMLQALMILFYANYCLNPIVYNIASARFRAAFRRLLSCSKDSQHQLSTVAMTTRRF